MVGDLDFSPRRTQINGGLYLDLISEHGFESSRILCTVEHAMK
jgi:hypothetical protein